MALKTNESYARFGDVVDQILKRDGIDTSQVGMATDIVSYINDRLQKAWSHEFWPQTMVVEKKHYHQTYAVGQKYEVGDILWSKEDQKYYYCNKPTSDFQLTPELDYVVVNTIVITDATHIKITATNTLSSGITLNEGELYAIELYNSEFQNIAIRHPEGTNNVDANGYGREWLLGSNRGQNWETAMEMEVGVPLWEEVGETTEWLKIIPYWQSDILPTNQGSKVIHRIESVSMRNPNRSYSPGYINYELLDEGILVSALAADQVWVKYQTEAPQFTLYEAIEGKSYSGRMAYGSTAKEADIVYDPNTKNCYKAISNTSSEDSFTDATKWEIVPFPKFLQRYVTHGAYADWLASEGQQAKSQVEDEAAEKILYDLMDIHAPSNKIQETLVYSRY
jgi:hypothetical protein